MTTFELFDHAAKQRVALGPAHWADWCSSGDLLLARDGRLFRIDMASPTDFDVRATLRELIDLSPLVFEPRAPPREATRWGGTPPSGVLLAPVLH